MNVFPVFVYSQALIDLRVQFKKLTKNLFFYPVYDLKIRKKKKPFWFLIPSSGLDHLQGSFWL